MKIVKDKRITKIAKEARGTLTYKGEIIEILTQELEHLKKANKKALSVNTELKDRIHELNTKLDHYAKIILAKNSELDAIRERIAATRDKMHKTIQECDNQCIDEDNVTSAAYAESIIRMLDYIEGK